MWSDKAHSLSTLLPCLRPCATGQWGREPESDPTHRDAKFQGQLDLGYFSGPASLVDLSMLLWKIFRWCVLSTFECSDVATAADCAKVCSDNFMPPISTSLEAMRMSLASLVAVVEL